MRKKAKEKLEALLFNTDLRGWQITTGHNYFPGIPNYTEWFLNYSQLKVVIGSSIDFIDGKSIAHFLLIYEFKEGDDEKLPMIKPILHYVRTGEDTQVKKEVQKLLEEIVKKVTYYGRTRAHSGKYGER